MDHKTLKSLAASILGCQPGELVNFRPVSGGVVTLNPKGQKFTISTHQLERQHARVQAASRSAHTAVPAKRNAQSRLVKRHGGQHE